MNDDQKIRMTKEKWDSMSDSNREKWYSKLEDVCIELMWEHPDYDGFTKVDVDVIPDRTSKSPSDCTCTIKWNGKNLDESTGWGMLKKEFPAYDIPIVTRRYSNILRNRTKDDDK